ncbi:GNAT family N-acetyltransferase [Spirilliplanes yamanashiensis]|nr:putative acetyltransferase [Spirilliplanes yamanashiensis]
MMERQLREVRDAGREPVAVLWASESPIYPRFGYGPAAQQLVLDLRTREVRVTAPPSGAVRLVDPAASWRTFAEVYDRERPHRTGWSSRDERWWAFVLADPPQRRDGATEWRAAVVDGPDGPAGYALWRTKGVWTPAGPEGRVLVREVVAADPGAYAALWRLLFDIDLTRELTAEPVGAACRRAGGAGRPPLPHPVDVVLDVTDPLPAVNTGR